MEVLAEIPRQIVEFYQFKNLRPEEIANLVNNIKNNNNNNNNQFGGTQIANNNNNFNPNPMNIIINNTYQNINQVDIYHNNTKSTQDYHKAFTQGNDIYLKNPPINNFAYDNNYMTYNNGLNNMNNSNNNNIISIKNGSVVNNNKNINVMNAKNYNQNIGSSMANNIDFDNIPVNETVPLDEGNI